MGKIVSTNASPVSDNIAHASNIAYNMSDTAYDVSKGTSRVSTSVAYTSAIAYDASDGPSHASEEPYSVFGNASHVSVRA